MTRTRSAAGRIRRCARRQNEKGLRRETQALNPHLAPAIEFALATAMRAGEIIGLCWVDVDRQRRVSRIREAKNGHPRGVPLSSKALAALESIERDGERVFSRLTSDTLKHLFARLTKRCELDNLRFHDLRHTAITRYARLDMNPIQLAVISGHKDIRMLARYAPEGGRVGWCDGVV
ncbi:site-specific integrase [Burkholderia cepacia]|uniref:site-specific integrase n=1 Tax=Burkholderia cepacia TaxID=292 RepID=UPI0009BE7E84|nr:site-specific integrase [Burkholderia cepacia]